LIISIEIGIIFIISMISNSSISVIYHYYLY